jgi:hypothetical protein
MQFEQEVVEMTRIRVTKRRKSTRLAALAALALAAMLVFPGIALAESPAQPDECSPSFIGPDDLVNPTPEEDDEIDDLANPTEDEDDEIDDLATPTEDDDDCDDLPDEVDGDEIPLRPGSTRASVAPQARARTRAPSWCRWAEHCSLWSRSGSIVRRPAPGERHD